MSKRAIVFPGQGSQAKGMLSEFYDNFSLFKNLMEEASSFLRYNLWDLILNDTNDKLNKTKYTQPALLATSIALYKIWLSEGGSKPDYFAGHSLGEYSALVCANSISFRDALTLVSERGRLMQSAVAEDQGAMAAILGLDDSKVEFICKQVSFEGGLVSTANYNSKGQVVIAGEKDAVTRAGALAKESGARKVVILNVTVPSHCPLMQVIADEFRSLLDDVTFNEPLIPVVHNFNVCTHQTIDDIKDALVRQLYNPVRWVETIEYFEKIGVSKVIECGPGKVLTSLNKRITKNLEYFAISDLVTFKKELELCL